MALKTLIVDDELNARVNLEIIIKEFCSQLEVVGLASSVAEAREMIDKYDPEVVFLDIAMPGGDGFSLLEHYPDRDFSVVFTTAYNEYALKAFKVDAVDYLEKPISIDDLHTSIEKILRIHTLPQTDADALAQRKEADKINDRISIPTKDGYSILKNEEIVYLEASDNYTMIYLSDGKRHLSSKNIKVYEDHLNSSVFYRIHKSYIINVEHHLKEFSRSEGNMAVLKSGKLVPVARRKVADFLTRINTF
jgi:two-component system, LytTR family, response regulator